MKLSKLRGAIRATKGNPSVIVELAPGVLMTLPLQKTPLMEELGRAFNNDLSAETELEFDTETGILSGPCSPTTPVAATEAKAADPFEDDEDDLL